LVNHPVHHVQ